ncbi:succinate dehydrogenase/fumarate reductase iron-sulfur subunit [Georgenia sp. SUBG003]|uniref:succinate dehydrogenase/fumarate reductase iron-sulfur subunit n=1 Tax=Georgenia sp. SUBG003 TaxID=1497974 RepID=UPI000AD0640B
MSAPQNHARRDGDDPADTAAPEGGCGGGCAGCGCSSTGQSPDTAASAVIGTIRIQVQRYRPDVDDAPHLMEYEVPWGQDTSVLDALTWIKDHRDPTLAFRWSCRMAICGSCGFMLNGVPKLGCEQFVRDYAPGPLRVEPLENMAVERDLVVDLEPFMSALSSVRPWLVEDPDHPVEGPANTQTPEQMLAYHDYAMCINCMLCYAACPQVSIAADFLGPAAVTAAVRYNRDSRDHGSAERLPLIDREDGLWSCTFVGACSTACPKGVDPAAAIQQAKAATAASWAAEFVLPRHGGQR